MRTRRQTCFIHRILNYTMWCWCLYQDKNWRLQYAIKNHSHCRNFEETLIFMSYNVIPPSNSDYQSVSSSNCLVIPHSPQNTKNSNSTEPFPFWSYFCQNPLLKSLNFAVLITFPSLFRAIHEHATCLSARFRRKQIIIFESRRGFRRNNIRSLFSSASAGWLCWLVTMLCCAAQSLCTFYNYESRWDMGEKKFLFFCICLKGTEIYSRSCTVA